MPLPPGKHGNIGILRGGDDGVGGVGEVVLWADDDAGELFFARTTTGGGGSPWGVVLLRNDGGGSSSARPTTGGRVGRSHAEASNPKQQSQTHQ